MDADLLHRVDRGLYRLLNAPRDVEGGTPVPADSPPREAANAELAALFERYREGFVYLQGHCMRWWRGCIASALQPGMSREEAVEEAYAQRAAGPASAPEFVWFIRHFWLGADAINRSLPLAERVAPQDVLLTWLSEAGEEACVELTTAMPYWPLGLDADGQWC
ncbi:MAG: hypothetical protein ABW220_13285 [Burkholderiaceae bacterium]